MNQARLLAVTLGCILTGPAGAAEPPKADPVIQEIKAVLRQHDEAINRGDMKTVIGLYADNPDVALVGTGPGEFWRGRALPSAQASRSGSWIRICARWMTARARWGTP